MLFAALVCVSVVAFATPAEPTLKPTDKAAPITVTAIL
jgi:hypothetical protein